MATTGEADPDFDGFTWIIWFIGNLLNMMILLNLIIALITNSFEKVIADSIIFNQA